MVIPRHWNLVCVSWLIGESVSSLVRIPGGMRIFGYFYNKKINVLYIYILKYSFFYKIMYSYINRNMLTSVFYLITIIKTTSFPGSF